jgi:hypothetical protein
LAYLWAARMGELLEGVEAKNCGDKVVCRLGALAL